MMQVIPAINCHFRDFGCVEEKIAAAGKFLNKGDWLHLDVADGHFTFNKTWQDAAQWANLRSEFNLEVHLMTEKPEKYLGAWISAGAKRFVVHVETLSEEAAAGIVSRAKKRGAEVLLASSPLTAISEVWPYLRIFSHFQVLAVDPGLAGQKFISVVLEKVGFLRNFAPGAMIEVDGGINLETGKLAKAAGANILVSASYIFGSGNPKKAYKALTKI